MIQSNELRIGNLLQFEDSICQVKGIDADGLGITVYFLKDEEETWIELDWFDPPPITPEWLEKCGFRKPNNADYYFLDITESTIQWHEGVVYVFAFDTLNHDDAIKTKAQYLHQLQNLYYALTGEELKITL